MTLPIDNFYRWLAKAEKGQVCIYHTGLLMADRMKAQWVDVDTDEPTRVFKLDRKLEDLRRAVLTASNLGDVNLTQRKLGEGKYEYLATRTGKDRAI